MEVVTCLWCNSEILEPRVENGKIVQKFCNRKCSDAWWNEPKKRAYWFKKELDRILKEPGEKFLEDLGALVKEYRTKAYRSLGSERS